MKKISELIMKNNIKKVFFFINNEKEGEEMAPLDEKEGTKAVVDFDNEQNIMSVYLPRKIQPIELESTFNYCKILEEIDFNNTIDFSKTKSINHIFCSCENLKKINFGDTSFINLQNAKNAFWQCENLKDILGLDLNCPELVMCANMFCSCSSLEPYRFDKANLSKVKNASAMFYGCNKFREIDMTNIDFSELEIADCMFMECGNLEKIKIKKIPKIVNGDHMFSNCIKLKKIEIDFNFKYIQQSKNMFENCFELRSFDFTKFNPENLIKAKEMFSGCNKLRGEVIFAPMKYSGHDLTDMFYDCHCITKIDMKAVEVKHSVNLSGFARNCKSLISIEMYGANTKTLTAPSFINGCESLVYLSFENLHAQTVNYIHEFAKDCFQLKVVKLGFDVNTTQNINSVFENCKELRVLQMPPSYFFTEKLPVMTHEHYSNSYLNCNKLRAISLENIKFEITKAEEEEMAIAFPEGIKLIYMNSEENELAKEVFSKRNTILSFI